MGSYSWEKRAEARKRLSMSSDRILNVRIRGQCPELVDQSGTNSQPVDPEAPSYLGEPRVSEGTGR